MINQLGQKKILILKERRRDENKKNYPRIQVWCTLRSISKHAGGRTQANRKKQRKVSIAVLSLLLLQPVCAPSRCSFLKHCRLSLSDAQKRAEWRGTHERGTGWLWPWRATKQTHTHTLPTVTAVSCRHSLPVNPLHHPFFCTASSPSPPLRHRHFRNMGKVKGRNTATQMKFNWNCTELEESPTISSSR